MGAVGGRRRKSSSLGGILPSDCRWERGKWGWKAGVASHRNPIARDPTLLVTLKATACVLGPQAGD